MSPRFLAIIGLTVWTALAPCWAKPALYLIGDSTVRNGTVGQMGWGDLLINEFDPAKIVVQNRAIGGRSSRTFFTSGAVRLRPRLHSKRCAAMCRLPPSPPVRMKNPRRSVSMMMKPLPG